MSSERTKNDRNCSSYKLMEIPTSNKISSQIVESIKINTIDRKIHRKHCKSSLAWEISLRKITDFYTIEFLDYSNEMAWATHTCSFRESL